ncbi:MAG: sigma-70 family RNA polymerase sigma factor [Planctomycetes bacterium]|nr:sigma-70 family RNA polymerase sigma factor [Planctomycetota bacterium]MBI3846161.1 sigma-70 family RNA polymerase sigma factor [Planctomycetota bacterium]
MSARETDAFEKRFHEMLQAHGPALWRLAGSYERRASDREDLYQEMCLALWRALGVFRGECSERTFVFRVAHNRAITRRVRRRATARDLDEAGDVADPRPRPDEALHGAERRERLAEAVHALPLGLRQVITLGLEGLSQSEIGDVLGVSENVVAVRMHRARAALRERLGESS